MGNNLFDGRPIRRVEIGPEDQPKLTADQKAGIKIYDRVETEARLRKAEPIWRAVVDFSNGSSGPRPTPPPAPEPAADTSVDWGGIDWGAGGFRFNPDDFLY